jgi:hypothetical protein
LVAKNRLRPGIAGVQSSTKGIGCESGMEGEAFA